MTSESDSGGRDASLETLISEAQAAVSSSANALRDVRERYRASYTKQIEAWERLRDEVARSVRGASGRNVRRKDSAAAAAGSAGDAAATSGRGRAPTGGRSSRPKAADGDADNAAIPDRREALQREEAMAGRAIALERTTLQRLELALRSLENAWLFLGRDDATLVMDPTGPASAADAQMRIVEAQEAERSRLAREVHDGPAQALANAVFQVEVVERLLDRDEALARAELQLLRETLTRELRSVRAYLSQLRPPVLADLGLSGAIHEAADLVGAIAGAAVTVEIDEELDDLSEPIEIVILRVIQEALQNVRKHAAATSIRVRVSRENGTWMVEVRDDGRGFDPESVEVPGRRNFGLQFMRERAELIGARFEVRSRPDLGTAVRMAIPSGAEERT
ncbi:MAG TPA: sensor histidine kinase [Candidatus Eisenbacteria bacterium]|nr:sensor histidine kinase [Candidatus Eisenbacteria bacterium]